MDNSVDSVLALLPASVREALESQDAAKLGAALDALPEEERQDILRQLHKAGIIGSSADIEALIASLPASVREALQAQDEKAFETALDALPEDERSDVVRQLHETGVIGVAADTQALIASLPPAVREALQAKDGPAFSAALDALPAEESQDIVQRLQEAGVIGGRIAPINDAEAAPVPPAVREALRARDEEALRAALDALPEDEREDALRQMAAAAAMRDDGAPDKEALVASLPPAVREAFQAQDGQAFKAALDALPEAERLDILYRLREADLIAGGGSVDIKAVMASMPASIREAMESCDNEKLQTALDALPDEERQDVLRRLHEAGVVGGGEAPDMEQMAREFEPMLQAISLIALAEEGAEFPDTLREALPEMRQKLEADLEEREQQGWHLRGAAERIWNGERDATALTANVDPNSAQLIHHILALIDAKSPGNGGA